MKAKGCAVQHLAGGKPVHLVGVEEPWGALAEKHFSAPGAVSLSFASHILNLSSD